MLPDRTLLFSATSIRLLSPVNAELFIWAFPFITIPSSGIFSPVFTSITSPIFTSSGVTCFHSSPCFKFAYSGFMFIKSDIDFLVLLTAFDSRIFPISYNVITINPSEFFPTKYAPIADTTISIFSSNTLFLNSCLNPFLAVLYSNITNAIIVNTLLTIVLNFPTIAIRYIAIPITILAISFPLCTSLSWFSSPSSNTSTSGSNFRTSFVISFLGLGLSVLNVNFSVEKLTTTSSYPSVFAISSSTFFAHAAQSNPSNVYL